MKASFTQFGYIHRTKYDFLIFLKRMLPTELCSAQSTQILFAARLHCKPEKDYVWVAKRNVNRIVYWKKKLYRSKRLIFSRYSSREFVMYLFQSMAVHIWQNSVSFLTHFVVVVTLSAWKSRFYCNQKEVSNQTIVRAAKGFLNLSIDLHLSTKGLQRPFRNLVI